jgi:hypothetical protein
MTDVLISKLIKDNLVIEITDNGIILSTNEIKAIRIKSIDDITDDLIFKLLENDNNR